MKIDLDELERKARAAEQDEWRWRDDDAVLEGVHNGQVVLFGEPVGECNPGVIVSVSDRDHIAANSPPVTLALIARIRELEAAASGNDCRAPGPQPCECCIARGGYT